MKYINKYTISVLLTVILAIIWYKNYEGTKDLNFIFTMLGTLASGLGTVITLLNVLDMRSVAEATKEAVNTNNRIFNDMISISKVVEAERLGDNIKSYLRSGNYEIAVIKIEEYIKLLIGIKNFLHDTSDFKSQYEELKMQIPAIANDNKNINIQIQNKENTFDVLPIIADIDVNIRNLVDISSKLSMQKTN